MHLFGQQVRPGMQSSTNPALKSMNMAQPGGQQAPPPPPGNARLEDPGDVSTGGTVTPGGGGGGSPTTGSGGGGVVVPTGTPSSGGGGSFLGSLFGQQIQPNQLSPTIGYPAQQQFFQSLLNNLLDGQGGLTGSAPYPGQLTPDQSKTILPNVQSNWQPWNTGTEYMANALFAPQSKGGLGIGTPDPNLHALAVNSGTGGQGNKGMAGMANYGTPFTGPLGQMVSSNAQFGTPSSAAGDPMHAIMQYGTPSTGALGQQMAGLAQYGAAGKSGDLLNGVAQGYASGPAAWLAPFLQGKSNNYQPANITLNPVLRAR